MYFKNKIIWITGASSGIGEALAIEWSGQETQLILSGRNRERLEKVAEKCTLNGSNCMVVVFDLEDQESVKNAVRTVLDTYAGIDILVNNGGISQRSYAKNTAVEVDRKIMETNFFGAVLLTKLVLPSMIKNWGGHIVVMSSVVGKFGFPLRTSYSASKHALQGYFDSLRAEMKKEHIRVTIVSPGRIKTNISVNAVNKDGEKYGIMDAGQEKGISAERCASVIIRAIKNNRKDIVIARKEKLMVWFRRFCPAIYYLMVSKTSAT